MPEIIKVDGKPVTRDFIGNDTERQAQDTTNLPVGSSWWVTDTKKTYLWDGTNWQDLVDEDNGSS